MKKKYNLCFLFLLIIVLASCNSYDGDKETELIDSSAQEYSDDEITSTTDVLLQDIDLETIDNSQSMTTNLLLINQTGNAYQTVSIQGNLAFAGAGNCLLALDISNPQGINAVGNLCGLPSVIKRIALTKDYAYIVDGDSLHIINISNPQQLVEVGSLDTKGTAESISVSGNFAYLADGKEGVRIVDVSVPDEPREVGCNESFNAIDIVILGDYAYIVDDEEFYLGILDISNPTQPIEIASYERDSYEPTNQNQYRFPAFHIAISGNYAYVADGKADLHIFEISDPRNLKEVGIYDTEENILSVATIANLVYLVKENKNKDSNNVTLILDVTDPSAPQSIGSFGISGNPMGLVVNNNFAYIIDQERGMIILDISNPELPYEIAYYDKRFDEFGINVNKVYDVAVNSHYLYILDESNLFIMDIADPENSEKVGLIAMPGNARVIESQGNYVYVITAESRFLVIDVSDPTDPKIVGTTHVSFYPYPSEFDIKDNYAYASGQIAEGVYELDIIDISNPVEPKMVYSYSYNVADSGFRGISVNNEYVYMVGYHCFLILDISDPLTPIEIFSDSTISGSDIDVVDNYAYVTGSKGLQIFNVSNPQKPELITSKSFGDLDSIYISDNYAYATGGYLGGAKVFDVSDPQNLSEVAFYSVGYAFNAVAFGDYIYIANWTDGLLMFRLSSE